MPGIEDGANLFSNNLMSWMRINESDPAKRFTVDQCLKRGCKNGLFEVNTSCFVLDFDLDDGVKAPTLQSYLSGGPAPFSFLEETYDNPIPTIELAEENSGYHDGERTPKGHSSSTFEGDCLRRPARRLKVSPHNTSEWSWTVGLNSFASEGRLTLEDQSTKSDNEDLSKLLIRKDVFSSDFGGSFLS